MVKVRSKDGTAIAFERTGRGPAVMGDTMEGKPLRAGR